MSDPSMLKYARATAAFSSIALRVVTFVFLRWIPGHPFPPIIYALFAAYVPSFFYTYFHTDAYEVVGEEIDIVTREYPDGDEDVAQDIKSRYANGEEVEEPLVELDVVDTTIIDEKNPAIFKTLMTGLPSPIDLASSILTFLVNVALVLMTLDFVYRAVLVHPANDLSFARVGYVSDTTAEVLVRERRGDQYPLEFKSRYAGPPVSIPGGYQALDSRFQTQGVLRWLEENTDFTGHVTFTGLRPDTRYQYTVSNNQSGYFTTAPRPGNMPASPGSGNVFTFLHSSCLKPNYPYNPLRHSLSVPGLKYLADLIPSLKASFMLFLGDFIYIDVPRRPGSSPELYRRDYRQVYASSDWTAASASLPYVHVFDDHEVANDWAGKELTEVYNASMVPYQEYHSSVNPPSLRDGEWYYTFTNGPASFFVMDTRSYRSPNDNTNGTDPVTGDPTKTMLGQRQLSDLLQWLKKPEVSGVRWKFVVSSVPFTRNWRINAKDTWAGYLGERQIILEAMWDVGSRGGIGVVVLSGDRHEFAATAFPPPPGGKEVVTGLGLHGVGASALGSLFGGSSDTGLQTAIKKWPQSATVYEFSASPLNMFYLPIHTYTEGSTSPDYVSDVCIKYLPDGNSKFGAVSISSSPTSDQSVLHYKAFIDGKEAWSHTLTTPPDLPSGGGRSVEYRKMHQLEQLQEAAKANAKRLFWE